MQFVFAVVSSVLGPHILTSRLFYNTAHLCSPLAVRAKDCFSMMSVMDKIIMFHPVFYSGRKCVRVSILHSDGEIVLTKIHM
jgi:hypothetical protein